MAHDPLGAGDMLIINDRNVHDMGIDSILDDAPFLRAMPGITASNGTVHKFLDYVQAPVTELRAINAGRDVSSSVDTTRTVTLKVLDASFRVDVAAAQSYKDGPEALLEREAIRHLRAALFVAEKSFFDFTTGFPSLSHLDALADGQVVNAAGTTAATASSVYLIRATPDTSSVAVVLGDDGKMVMEEASIISADDGTGKEYPAYFVSLTGWCGLQYGGQFDVVRIANLTADTGKGLTDDLLSDALSLFGAGRQPTHIVMNRRSMKQLQKSRTTYSPTGMPAPRPSEYEGIPIIVTDGILSTEAIET